MTGLACLETNFLVDLLRPLASAPRGPGTFFSVVSPILPMLLGTVSKLSTKGQIVIPEQVRRKVKLKPGDEFLVTAVDNAILLTKIDRQDLRRRLDRILEENKALGFSEEDVLKESRQVRHGKEA